MTPLHLAAKGGLLKIVNYFVEKGPDINIQDDIGVNLCHTNAGRLNINLIYSKVLHFFSAV